VVPTQLVVV
jgi:hypothetical protein